jgi:hypothetical protein
MQSWPGRPNPLSAQGRCSKRPLSKENLIDARRQVCAVYILDKIFAHACTLSSRVVCLVLRSFV